MFIAPDFPPAPRRRHFDNMWSSLCFVALAPTLLVLPIVTGPRYRTATPALHGELRIAGSFALRGTVERWAAIFHREHPGVRLRIALAGSGAAADALVQGQADVAPMTRSLRAGERALFAAERTAPLMVPLGQGKTALASGNGPWRPVSLYLYFRVRPPEGALEFARIATSAEGTGRSRRSLLELIVGPVAGDAGQPPRHAILRV